MKTKQEQINKLASTIFEIIGRENIDRFTEDENGNLVRVETVGIEGIAEALIKAGYGDISEYKAEIERLTKILNNLTTSPKETDIFGKPKLLMFAGVKVEEAIKRVTEYNELKAENTTLYEVKSNLLKENDELLKANVALILNKRQAQIDVLNRLKVFSEPYPNSWGIYVIDVYHIDELIKEVQNGEDKD